MSYEISCPEFLQLSGVGEHQGHGMDSLKPSQESLAALPFGKPIHGIGLGGVGEKEERVGMPGVRF